VTLFDREALYAELQSRGHCDWAAELRRRTNAALSPEKHGKLDEWITAWQQLPAIESPTMDCSGDAVTLTGEVCEASRIAMENSLRTFHPWRKGPFDLFGIPIDTEWRSCWKWNRLAPHVNLLNRNVLDVGCGNGYYGWKMLGAGARMVVGFDPFLLFLMQFECVRKYAGAQCNHFVLPLTDADLPQRLNFFDVTFSMGVLYHRTSPIDHLQSLWHSLTPGGMLVLETLVIEGEHAEVLVPEDRYAKMRNVWFIPSVPLLLLWLRRCGFREVKVLDVSRTTSDEQRRTDWMTFESLADFLDPSDSQRTIEGYPAPVRAMVTARR
jgi:tRNA (mo5U34)-methyltransferase